MPSRFRMFAGAAALVSISVAMGAAACGGGGGDSGGNADLSGVTVRSLNATPTAGAQQIIEVKDGSFDPKDVTIKAGTTIVWKWTSSVSCSLLLGGQAAPEQSSGQYERLFSTGGSTFSYQCAGKPDMVGKITVE